MSNVKINFPKCNHKKHQSFEYLKLNGKKQKDLRSTIPNGVIENIFKHFENETWGILWN